MSCTRKKTWAKSAFNEISKSQPSAENMDASASEAVNSRSLKRYKSDSFDFNDGSMGKHNATTVTSKVSLTPTTKSCTGGSKSSDTSNKSPNCSTDWMENFAPIKVEDLAVHVKKVAELQNWFLHCDAMKMKHPAQMCLLTGPTGCAKTATAHVLANACNYQLQEWINPLDQEVTFRLGDQAAGGSYIGSQLDAFKDFLLRASRYKSLLEWHAKRLLLVEDFPNALITDATMFEAVLQEYSRYGKSPLLFIVADSESRGLNISYNIFSANVKKKFNITHISYNPINVTLMQKAMKRFCTIMRSPNHAAGAAYKVPTQVVIDSIMASAQGDIRNALINLHFASLKGAVTPLELNHTKAGRLKKTQSSLKSVGRNESITMLHALGRVFNPKFTNDRKFLHNPEEIAVAFAGEPKKFINFLHANYLGHFSGIEHLTDAANDLSLADVILREYREAATLAPTALDIGVRGVMVSNAAPISAWMSVRGPKRLDIDRKPYMVALKQFDLNANISMNLYASDYSTYVRCIGKKQQISSTALID